ncbi:MAG: hypothetical protein HY717_20960 [Planctomycetes bacterium]|nr:hypothetical protein [Planctomycetota bacterium]
MKKPLGISCLLVVLMLLPLGALVLSGCAAADKKPRTARELLDHKREIIAKHSRELSSEEKGVILYHPGRSFAEIDRTLYAFLLAHQRQEQAEKEGIKLGAARQASLLQANQELPELEEYYKRHRQDGKATPYTPYPPLPFNPPASGNGPGGAGSRSARNAGTAGDRQN